MSGDGGQGAGATIIPDRQPSSFLNIELLIQEQLTPTGVQLAPDISFL